MPRAPRKPRLLDKPIAQRFFRMLIRKTNNFDDVRWMGNPIWQNVLDAWNIQETITAIKPALIIETGTNRGGSSLYYAHLMDIMGRGKIITVDVEKLHTLSHPRIQYIIGSSVDEPAVSTMRAAAKQAAGEGPVLVILDSDHSAAHVRKELDVYAPLVTRGSYCLVQDGVIDTHPAFKAGRPGPLVAIEDFMRTSTDFEIDQEKCDRFLITHHPKGWLKRK